MKLMLMGEEEGIRRAKFHRVLGGGGSVACSDYVVACVELIWRMEAGTKRARRGGSLD
jgi:hypothetical protein